MKKFTLLAMAALAAGSSMGYAQETVTLPGGLIPSTAENPVYYKITNMRADRFSYITNEIWNAAHDDVIATEDPSTGTMNGANAGKTGLELPKYLPDENLTPEIWTMPYMGLVNAEGNFWTAFSAQPEVMNPYTIYWWFEATGSGNSVYIHNAVVGGALKSRQDNIYGRPAMSFSTTAKQPYYVIPLTEEQIEDLALEDDPFGTNAFALSATRTMEADSRDCLDVNNYISFNWTKNADGSTLGPWINNEDEMTDVAVDEETGEPKDPANAWYDANEEVWVKAAKYGFASIKRAWNPCHPNSAEFNNTYNNGSLFKVTLADEALVKEAIEKYQEVVYATYREGVIKYLEEAQDAGIARIEGLRNLPELYSDANRIESAIAAIEGMTAEVSNVKTLEDVEVMKARIDADIDAQVVRAMSAARDNTVIRLKQMLALRDWEDAYNAGEDNEENLGDAYLSSNGFGQVKYEGSMQEVLYPAVTCLLKADASCDWTIEWVAGQGYRLKNGDKYIRYYGAWENVADWAGILDIDVEELPEGQSVIDGLSIFTWATTTNVEEAAVFNFSGCAEAIQDVTFSESDQNIIDSYGEDMGYADEEAVRTTTNICHLQAPDAEGNASWLCRDTAAQNYTVISWNAGNWYFANPNAWKVEVVTPGEEVPDGISEISANNVKATGIYDLQGRKVAKVGKGLYIINGVKTVVK